MGAVDLRRLTQLAVALLAAVLASVAVAAPAAAQNTDQNEFQSFYEECRDGEVGGGFLDGGLLSDTGAHDWMRESAHAGGLRETLTAPVRGVQSAACNTVGAALNPTDAAEAIASGFWGDPIGDFVKSLLEGNAQSLALIMTMWIKESPFSGADFASSVEGIFNLTLWAQALLFVVSLIVAGTRMAIARNRGLGDGFEDVGQLVFNFVLAGAALPVVILSLHLATDAVSAQWLTDGLGGDPAAAINAVALIDEETGLGPAAVLILVVFALLGALAQMVALVVREGLLVVVVGLLPLAAASFAMNTGKQAFKSMIGFVVAALLFKPVATLLYLAAFWMSSGTQAPSVMEAVSSMLLLAAAGLVLPALMRVVAPAVSASVAGGSAAGIGAVAAGATGAVAGAAGAALGSASQSMAGAASPAASGSGGQGAANGAAYLGPHSSGSSSTPPSGGGSGPTPAAPAGAGSPAGASPAGGGSSSGGGAAAKPQGGVAGAVAGAGRGASAVAGLAGAGVGAVASAAHGAARMTQSTEQMLDGALAAHPTPHHYR
ncbi:hypothetical protein ACTHRK_17120 [Dietzia cercidiphylli]|uniref:hypothetical protein n=2 Tax=Dietziaceae TaxID=85029 RepID=UPI0015951BB0|nr:hypothetical protein [Dietzia natronolimnaea]